MGGIHEAEIRAPPGHRRPPGAPLPEDLLADDEGVADLIRIAGGNFRSPDRLLSQIGRILEIDGSAAVTREVAEAAREVPVIGAAQRWGCRGVTALPADVSETVVFGTIAVGWAVSRIPGVRSLVRR